MLMILSFRILFIITAWWSKTALGRAQDRQERANRISPPAWNHCPSIPTCQWSQFQPLELKVEQGAQSTVSMLMDEETGKQVLKKRYTVKQDFLNELTALSCIRVGHHGLLAYPVCVDSLRMIVVLEWAGDGDLTRWDLFRSSMATYNYGEVVRLSAQIIAAVAASHRRGILHGDVKPENFVLNIAAKRATLIDFGLSARIGDFRIMTQGTPQTMAPEVAFPDFYEYRLAMGKLSHYPPSLSREMFDHQPQVRDKPQVIREAMDWWSAGVTIYYLMSKYFDEKETLTRRSSSQKMSANIVYSNSTADSSNEEEFIIQRPELSEVEGDDHYFPYSLVWSENGSDILNFFDRAIPEEFPQPLVSLLKLLMAWNPENRSFAGRSLLKILSHPLFRNIDWFEIDPSLRNKI